MKDLTLLHVDRSSCIMEGKRQNRYTPLFIERNALWMKVGILPNSEPAQICELYALTQFLKFLKPTKAQCILVPSVLSG